jgi:hypothetical protein
MFKRITLLIFVVFNLNIYSQVVIKDEIVLDEVDNTEAETLQTPFYGNISIRFVAPGQKMRAYFMVDGQTKFLNEINGTTYNCICGNPLWPLTANWTFYGIPAFSDVELQVLQCRQVAPPPPPNGTCDWVELPVDFQVDPQNQNRRKIYVDVNYPNTPPDWRYSGYITFKETTPPVCSYAPACSTGYTVTMPDTLSVNKPSTFTIEDECEPYIAANNMLVWPVSFFSGVRAGKKFSNIMELSSNDEIEVCFDLQTQKWKFNLLVDNATLNYVKDICLTNILDQFNAQPIYNLSSIDNVDASECNKLLSSIESHKIYPPPIYDEYAFIEIWLVHETEHQKDWEKIVGKYINNYFNIPQKINYKCEDFDSLQQAKQEILKKIQTLFAYDFLNPYLEDWMKSEFLSGNDEETKIKKGRRERAVHIRPAVLRIIEIYKEKIREKCKTK